jgi:hypothetical protein
MARVVMEDRIEAAERYRRRREAHLADSQSKDGSPRLPRIRKRLALVRRLVHS